VEDAPSDAAGDPFSEPLASPDDSPPSPSLVSVLAIAGL
jgi:hypothetical protein